MRNHHPRFHEATLVICSLAACWAVASANECWVGAEKEACLLYLGAEDVTKCSQLQMAFGARAPAYTMTSPSRPCLALVPKECSSLDVPQCHTFEATQAMQALGDAQQPEDMVIRRLPQQLAPTQAWQCYVTDANECLLDPVAITDSNDAHNSCDELHKDGQWDTCLCGSDVEEAWQHCASPGGFCDRRIRGAEDVVRGRADLADVLDGAKGLYHKTCSAGVRPSAKASAFQRLLSAHLPHKMDIYSIP